VNGCDEPFLMVQRTRRTTTELTMLSEARTNVSATSGELSTSEVEGFPIWEVFTKKKDGDSHLHAGSLSAPDASFAQLFAREHYGQDQVCISLWLALRETCKSDLGEDETYEVFVQSSTGSKYEHAGEVEASNGADARSKCQKQFVGDKPFYSIWACPISKLTKIEGKVDMIWRETTDQSYRLASGYSRVVRKKWDALRASKDVDTYQEEDLKDTF
jgi:ring-1,2-phenylacetyl-CoA epoxidase subunit PaaB